MQLQLPLPSDWLRGDRLAIVPGHGDHPDLTIRWSPIRLLPDEQRPWIQGALQADLPAPTARVRVTEDATGETHTGWPVRLVEATVHDGDSDQVIEWRLAAFFAFFEHAASVLVRATDGPRYREHRERLRDLLAGGAPDWSGEPAALAQLWDVTSTGGARQPRAATPAHAPAHAHDEPPADLDAAIAAWERAAAADPTEVDALYNAGLARYGRGEPEAALASWRQALDRAPGDFWILRKIIQAQYALGRYDDAAATRTSLLDVWRGSADPAVRLADEIVFDQFDVDGVAVHASETLRPRDPTSYAVYTFRVATPLDGGPLCVSIETSDYAKLRGAPYVLSILDGARYRALGTSEALPPYPELRKTVHDLISRARAARVTS